MTRLGLLLFCLTLAAAGMTAHAAPFGKVYDTRAGKMISEKTLWERMARVDVVFIGEQHDDPQTHLFERQALEELTKRVKTPPILAMEMFERDAQTTLDEYLAGKTDELTFLKASRPWPNYATDYRPLIEFAKSHQLTVVAGNIPRALASKVGRDGMAATKDFPAGQSAALVQAPQDDYWQRFSATMSDMGGAHGGANMDAATIARFYDAQVLKDETMAESIVAARNKSPETTVLHVNGQFHSDYGGGIPRRVLWRQSMTQVVTISVIPIPAGASLPKISDHLADYVVFVPATPKPETPPAQVK